MRRILFAIVALCGLCGASPAKAHKPSDSYLTLRVDGQAIEGQWDIALRDLDFAIAIRTAVCRGDVFEVTAGAGIVEASVPKSEADETRSKARGVLCAIEAAPHG